MKYAKAFATSMEKGRKPFQPQKNCHKINISFESLNVESTINPIKNN